ncbi:MAG TPA: response regulator transcription factor [Candidatus Megaira endosymbiont of Nemacystus decipiens]|nr:response regulator transcription factor [Candidatus Megaera endosymbiont of Nemacystus decipiens]
MTNVPHVLIVDDDSRILKLLKSFFNQNNYLVTTTTTPTDVSNLINYYAFDLIILDVMMPEISGKELATKIKKTSYSDIPIIMLTAMSEQDDIIEGLKCGANDYIAKPFDPRELLLRAQNLIKFYHLSKKNKEFIQFGVNTYNTVTKTLTRNNKKISISSNDIKLLDIFINEINKVISRDELSVKLGSLNPRSIDVQIVRLRKKIEADPKYPDHLKTVRNQGYAFYI